MIDQPESKLNWKAISFVSVLMLAAYRFYVIKWQFNFFHFLVPPSPDLVAHLQMTDGYINGTAKLGAYPPLLHIIAAFFANAFHVNSLAVFNLFAPFWIPVAIIVFYLLVAKIFDYKVAFWSTLVFAFVSTNPMLNFGDAQYSDILGYNLVGPFYIIALVSLIKDFKYWKVLLVFLLFGLFLSAHSLSAVLLFIISFIAVAIYCFISFKTDKHQFKGAFFTLIALCGGSILFLALSKILFGPIISTAAKSIINLNSLFKDSTAAVLPYDSISSLLPPFLEFVGMAGVGFLLLRISRGSARFASLFVIVWILIAWIFSRSSLFVLPQRILREIPLPLSIAAGILAVDMLALLKNRWQKIIFFGLFLYLVVINNYQITASVFILPGGFSGQVWFRDVDQQKYDFFVNNINKQDKILVNSSNPVLGYKLSSAGYQLTGFYNAEMTDKSDAEKSDFINTAVKDSGDKYLFIGAMPSGVNPDVYFTSFIDYKTSTDLLNAYNYPEKDMVKQFPDGSKLILIK